jgi:hypothetical protein
MLEGARWDAGAHRGCSRLCCGADVNQKRLPRAVGAGVTDMY